MILYRFELALTPPSILFNLRTLGNFPAFLRMCMIPIYLVPSYRSFCVFTLLSLNFMKLKLTKALNISTPLLRSNSMNNHAQNSKGLLQAEQIYIGLSTSCSKFSAEFSKTFPVIYQFELALTPPSILFSLRTLGNFPAFLRMCMMLIYLVPSYQLVNCSLKSYEHIKNDHIETRKMSAEENKKRGSSCT